MSSLGVTGNGEKRKGVRGMGGAKKIGVDDSARKGGDKFLEFSVFLNRWGGGVRSE